MAPGLQLCSWWVGTLPVPDGPHLSLTGRARLEAARSFCLGMSERELPKAVGGAGTLRVSPGKSSWFGNRKAYAGEKAFLLLSELSSSATFGNPVSEPQAPHPQNKHNNACLSDSMRHTGSNVKSLNANKRHRFLLFGAGGGEFPKSEARCRASDRISSLSYKNPTPIPQRQIISSLFRN